MRSRSVWWDALCQGSRTIHRRLQGLGSWRSKSPTLRVTTKLISEKDHSNCRESRNIRFLSIHRKTTCNAPLLFGVIKVVLRARCIIRAFADKDGAMSTEYPRKGQVNRCCHFYTLSFFACVSSPLHHRFPCPMPLPLKGPPTLWPTTLVSPLHWMWSHLEGSLPRPF